MSAPNPFGAQRHGISPLRIAAVAAALLLTGVAVYSQLDRHPDWIPHTQAKVGDTIQGLRERVQELQQRSVIKESAASVPAGPASLPREQPAPPVTEPAATPAPSVIPPAPRPRPVPAQTAAPAAPIFVSFQSERVTVGEGANAAVLVLKRDASMIGRTFVHWRVAPGTATAGEDYAAYAGGRAEFADNQPLRAIYVPLMRDGIAEPSEEFFVELYDAGPHTRIWPVQRAAVTLQDDD